MAQTSPHTHEETESKDTRLHRKDHSDEASLQNHELNSYSKALPLIVENNYYLVRLEHLSLNPVEIPAAFMNVGRLIALQYEISHL